MPTRASDGGEGIDCVIREVGEVMCGKGFRFALSGVCKYQVVRGSADCSHQAASAQQGLGIQVSHSGIAHVVDDEHILPLHIAMHPSVHSLAFAAISASIWAT
ncbi:MAG: hypothetical protein ACKPKO_33655, partial [Candidatus Fonsibacter sp.]